MPESVLQWNEVRLTQNWLPSALTNYRVLKSMQAGLLTFIPVHC